MGRSVVCKCGQRNDLGVFAAGEARLCLACGAPLPNADAFTPLLEESFVPEVPLGAFEEAPSPSCDVDALKEFESPSFGETPSTPVAPPEPTPRIWTSGLRELAVDESLGQCIRCNRTFRGPWDVNQTKSGALCHVCSVQAEQDRDEITLAEKRELYRPSPPKPLASLSVGSPVENLERKQKIRGLITLLLVAAATVLAVIVLPVEHWVAHSLETDLSKASELPVALVWGVRVIMFFVRAFAQTVALYATLTMLNMLTDDERQERFSLIYLGIVFALINSAADILVTMFSTVPLVGAIFVGLTFVVTIFIQLSMVSSHFNVEMESGCGFFLAWILVATILWPCMYMVSQFIGGVLAGILL